MAVNEQLINYYKKIYYANELPVPYKLKCGMEINIHPIKVKDWELFESSLGILTMDKNKIPDPSIISMSYLDFLYQLIYEKTEGIVNMLLIVLNYSLGEQYEYSMKKLDGRTFLIIDDKQNQQIGKISSKEFDEISQIILTYNLVNYDNRKMSSDIQQLISDYYKLQNNGRTQEPTLEEKKVYVIMKSGISIQQLNEMSYRIFSQVYSTALECDLYLSNKIIQSSQKYETKGEIIHPLLEKKIDILDKIFKDADSFIKDTKAKLG